MPITEEDFDRVYHVLFGNGDVGLDEAVRTNTRVLEHQARQLVKLDNKIDTLQKSINDLAAERRGDQQRREGALAAVGWMKYALGVLALLVTIGGAVGYVKVDRQNAVVIEQLRNLPPLPE